MEDNMTPEWVDWTRSCIDQCENEIMCPIKKGHYVLAGVGIGNTIYRIENNIMPAMRDSKIKAMVIGLLVLLKTLNHHCKNGEKLEPKSQIRQIAQTKESVDNKVNQIKRELDTQFPKIKKKQEYSR